MRSRYPILVAAAALAAAPALRAQAAPVPLSLSRAVAVAADTAAGVRLAGLRVDEAEARVRQARSALLPSVGGTASALNRTFNKASLGIEFPSAPGVPSIPDEV